MNKLIVVLVLSLAACKSESVWSEWVKRPSDGMACRYTKKPLNGKFYLECRIELINPEPRETPTNY